MADVPSRGVSRRALLRATGIGAAGLTAAPWLRHAAAVESATPVAGITDSAWYDLANRLRGRLLRPGDILYPAATIINATRYMRERPAGIAICAVPGRCGGLRHLGPGQRRALRGAVGRA